MTSTVLKALGFSALLATGAFTVACSDDTTGGAGTGASSGNPTPGGGTGTGTGNGTGTGTGNGTGTGTGNGTGTGTGTGSTTSTFATNGFGQNDPWAGYLFTVVDEVGGTISPECNDAGTAICFSESGAELCATGTLAASYESFALIGWNIAQEIDPETMEGGAAGLWTTTGTGVTVGVTNNGTTGLRVQLQAGEERWCADLPNTGGTIPWGDFAKECWEAGGEAFTVGTAIDQIQVQTFSPSNTASTPYNYCVTNIQLAP